MIGVVLVAHGAIAESYFDVVKSISGPQKAFNVLAMSETDNMENKRQELMRIIDDVNQGKGVVVLTDLFGGTPANLAISILGIKQVEVIAGFNLPMILKLLSVRTKDDLATAVQKTEEAGKKHICIASEFLTANGAQAIGQPHDQPQNQLGNKIAKSIGYDL